MLLHMAMTLSDEDRAILDFESSATWWRYAGSKEAEIRERFDMTPTRYYQRLSELLAFPPAEMYAPQTVRRLRAQLERRSAHRSRP